MLIKPLLVLADLQLQQLLTKIAVDNDQRAFSLFFDQYQTRLLRYANLYVKDMQAAEDVVSDVLIRLLKNRKKHFVKDNFISFLFTCIKNQCLDHLKKEKRRTALIAADSDEIEYFVFNHQTPFTKMIQNELDEIIKHCIEALPPKRKAVFLLVKDDQLPHKEVAEIMGISVRTVEVHLKLALLDIKKVIDKYLENPGLRSDHKMQIIKAFSLLAVSLLQH
ncbi:RNA polymerase sigma factor [Fulvivirga ligni]|uniref:RNA polymerase sigma factor n=1 Tax=Fulvivirga ligni TaxID=2904246 RepID=UPI001F45D977|nr:RNA polymerase sigma-70 factor [Fulvivirga ligni]UII19601.1 RNA polymerase sigma-70 factor [Fulvivirga ligni]